MKMIRIAICMAVGMCSMLAFAQEETGYPSRPITFIVPFTAGGSSDNLVRVLAVEMSKDLGQPVIVENVVGATGTIGAAKVARAKPDGYTIILLGGTPSLYMSLNPQAGLDFQKSFSPISAVALTPMLLVVNAQLPVKNIQEFIAYGKTGKPLNHGTAGLGGVSHITSQVFRHQSGLMQITDVPYKGSAAALADVSAGHIQMMFESFGTANALVTGGKLRALAILSPKRSALSPEIPTAVEAGFPDLLQSKSWFGALTSPGTPAPIVNKLSDAITSALARPHVKAKLAQMGMEPMNMTPAEFSSFIREDTDGWKRLITKYSIKTDN